MTHDEWTAAVGLLRFFLGLLFTFGIVSGVTWAAWDTVQRCQERTETDRRDG